MKNILTQTEAQQLKQNSDPKNSHNVGEIYPEIFDTDKDFVFDENIPLNVAIIWLGSFELQNNIFPKEKCPICGKEEVLIPYFCGASILSGCHTIKLYCTSCKERIVFNNKSNYYHMIRDYILKNKNTLQPSKVIQISYHVQ